MNIFCECPWVEYVDAFGTDEFKPIKFPMEKKEFIVENIKKYLKSTKSGT